MPHIVDGGHRRALDLAIELHRRRAGRGGVERAVGAGLRPRSPSWSRSTARRWCSSTRGASSSGRPAALERAARARSTWSRTTARCRARCGCAARAAAQARPGQVRGGHRVARARHRRGRGGPGGAAGLAALVRHLCCSGWAARATRWAARRRGGCSRSPAISWSSARRWCGGARRATSTRSCCATRRSTSWRSRSSRRAPPRSCRRPSWRR